MQCVRVRNLRDDVLKLVSVAKLWILQLDKEPALLHPFGVELFLLCVIKHALEDFEGRLKRLIVKNRCWG